MLRLIDAATLTRNPDLGAKKRLFDAKAKQTKLTAQLAPISEAANTAYTGLDEKSKTMTFEQFAARRVRIVRVQRSEDPLIAFNLIVPTIQHAQQGIAECEPTRELFVRPDQRRRSTGPP
jgi:hypothetical protein